MYEILEKKMYDDLSMTSDWERLGTTHKQTFWRSVKNDKLSWRKCPWWKFFRHLLSYFKIDMWSEMRLLYQIYLSWKLRTLLFSRLILWTKNWLSLVFLDSPPTEDNSEKGGATTRLVEPLQYWIAWVKTPLKRK